MRRHSPLSRLLDLDCTSFQYDLRKQPAEAISPRYYQERGRWATKNGTRKMRIYIPQIPWSIEITGADNLVERELSIEDVWRSIHRALQEPLTESEWISAVEKGKSEEIKENTRIRTGEDNKEPLRIDWLGSETILKGLYRDQRLVESRLLPGREPSPESWVARLEAQRRPPS